jgi:biopolymer transport protein ExbD
MSPKRDLDMKKNKTLKSVLLVLIVAVTITCCAAPASVIRMEPSFGHTRFVSSNMTLIIAEVKGGKKTNPMLSSTIENESFREALKNTLNKSRIFINVSKDKKGDYKLYTEIISQELKAGFTMTSILFVNYILIENKSSRELWKENILSQYDVKFKGEWVQERARKANEGAVRDNLTQLVKKLSNVISQLE